MKNWISLLNLLYVLTGLGDLWFSYNDSGFICPHDVGYPPKLYYDKPGHGGKDRDRVFVYVYMFVIPELSLKDVTMLLKILVQVN